MGSSYDPLRMNPTGLAETILKDLLSKEPQREDDYKLRDNLAKVLKRFLDEGTGQSWHDFYELCKRLEGKSPLDDEVQSENVLLDLKAQARERGGGSDDDPTTYGPG